MINKFDLKDITFLILIRLDSIERLENILIITQFLVTNFDTNIDVLECSPYNNGMLEKLLDKEVKYSFLKDRDPILFRTKFINQMAKRAKTPYISVWDADVLFPVNQITGAVELLRKDEADFVIPYEKQALEISGSLRMLYIQENDINTLLDNAMLMKEIYAPNPMGGAFFCSLKLFYEAGMENEKFYGWGMEDCERHYRWKRSGYRIKRETGPLFHLTHPRGANSNNASQQDLYTVKKRAYYASGRIKKEKQDE